MRKKERAELTRAKLIKAAATTFDDKGFRGTSLQDVCEAAGVTKGALYFHFPSKDALALAVIEEHYRGWPPSVDSLLLTSDGRALQALVDLSFQFGSQLVGDPVIRAAVRLVFESEFDEPEPRRAFSGWISAVGSLLEQARAQGDTRDGLDLTATAELLVGVFTGSQLVAQSLTGRKDMIERIRHLWVCFLPGVRPDGAPADLRLEPPALERPRVTSPSL
ncbi:TetR/AcrR family transcriptional regulator [Allokutzneria sp. A3M-2-11 16]|uniref:ScbR family autoregulator-binding transcription factor n=1 Tax=Allokutzneria sp. A3M-2-11 16 TaxID=2962043 RepID=UPI0020B804BA|nr:ScbR family autoregulator-binding transcription factor [Allokutzneria sp. A3M-2-11 16]MCP3804223.1 TetR/AcrR family transcriptional regulator [Allokutzneria sp. A3M-2-11 16]